MTSLRTGRRHADHPRLIHLTLVAFSLISASEAIVPSLHWLRGDGRGGLGDVQAHDLEGLPDALWVGDLKGKVALRNEN